MKKIILLPIIVAFFLVLQTEESISQCPPDADGWQIYTFNVAGCEYDALLCWTCGITMQSFELSIPYVKKLDPSCTNGLSMNEVRKQIFDIVNSEAWLVGLCFQSFPPCNVTTYEYSFKDYNCWYMFNTGTHIEYYACSFSSWCQQDWEACWDQQYGFQPTMVNDWYQVGTLPEPCASQQEPLVDPDPGETSVCWPLNYPCN